MHSVFVHMDFALVHGICEGAHTHCLMYDIKDIQTRVYALACTYSCLLLLCYLDVAVEYLNRNVETSTCECFEQIVASPDRLSACVCMYVRTCINEA
jgi:hypothetical protein